MYYCTNVYYVILLSLFFVQDGDTALILAASTGQFDIVKLLLHQGADPNIVNKVST